MEYSGRVNSKQGSGGIASKEDANVHTKQRIQELLATHVLDLDNDPYVFRNHLGMLECRLCLTTHTNESSYISHLGGKKHMLNLERRRILDEKQNRQRQQLQESQNILSINTIEKRHWNKIGKPAYKVTKIRDPKSLRIGILISVKFPKIAVTEPMFRIMSYYELTSKNQINCHNFIEKYKSMDEDEDEEEDEEESDNKYQCLVIYGEPYDNIAFVIPNNKEIDKPVEENKMSDSYWWYWDNDTKEFFLQFLYKK
ncbi:Pre-mRNA-splicing factor sap62 [Candida viswanathii]|uniref:Pre-mRNA-splicing factor sap62 n=1 Tax=Candida viswanathii TaxID=5486 RepID=A0A367YCL6_9ASCO|nr:Pre-mRNA-splicing factor sap62 [Candida viswanathii]